MAAKSMQIFLVINSLQKQREQVWSKLVARLANARLKFERQMRLEEWVTAAWVFLDPVLTQQKKVAASGLADARQVAAGQRIVSIIRGAHRDVAEKLAE